MTIGLIVNADDYGRTPEVSAGIRHAHLHGIVTSTTAMMNIPGVEADLDQALKETPNLGLGVHLVLTSGRPQLPPEQTPSLVRPDGSFLNLFEFTEQRERVNLDEIRREWRAQVDKFVAHTGRSPTHLDSHHHSSYFTAGIFRSMLELAGEYDCAIRIGMVQTNVPVPLGMPEEITQQALQFAPPLLAEFQPRRCDDFYATFYDEFASLGEILRIIQALPPGSHEVMCHPGYTNPALLAGSVYASQREVELSVLTDPRVKAAIEARGVELITFAEV